MYKAIFGSLLTVGLCGAFAVYAAPLTIDNQTDHDSTSVINKGSCSASVPGGVTRAHTKNVVPETLLRALCGMKDCTADIYMQDNCRGPIIATAVFNVKVGLKSISQPINGYGFEKLGPFSIIIKGGPKG